MTGLNIWPFVHITDVASQFTSVLSAALSKPNTTPHGEGGYFLATAGEYTLLQAARVIGHAMVKQDLAESSESEPTSFDESELEKYFAKIEDSGGTRRSLGTNSRGISAQAERLGWKPKFREVDGFYEYCRGETGRIAGEGKPFWRE